MESFDVASLLISCQKEAERITRPVLDALGEDYSVCCQGMIFSFRWEFSFIFTDKSVNPYARKLTI